MKKVIALVMCVAMIACIAVSASAATKATFTISTTEYAKVGDTVAVTISVAEEKTWIGALGFTFSYDKEALEFVANERGQYFIAGEVLKDCSASCVGNEETMAVQLATADGFFIKGELLTLNFKVLKDIEDVSTIDATLDVIKCATDTEDSKTEYDSKVVAGGVKAKAAEVVVEPPVSSAPPVPSVPIEVTPDDVDDVTSTNPKTGDVTGIAVAAGLCAVMAAAFVITKKVND